MQLLKENDATENFTAGAAIGLERLVMVASDTKSVNQSVPIPWRNNTPPFARREAN